MFGIPFFQNKLIQINWTSNCFHFKVDNSLIWIKWTNIHEKLISHINLVEPLVLENQIFTEGKFPEVFLCVKNFLNFLVLLHILMTFQSDQSTNLL